MAGLINLQSADPAPVASQSVSLSVGGDALAHFSGTVNAPLGERLALRVGYHQARTNGFRENQFLHIEDSNRRRENFARAKLRYADPNRLLLLLTAFRSDQDNGYDAWAPDNNEDLITYSDNKGVDHQTTTAFSLRAEKPLLDAQLVSISAFSTTDLEYSFDGDWGNDQYWLQAPYNFDPAVEGWSYDFFDRTLRQRDTFTQELRLLRGEAVLGAYFKTLEETDRATGYLFGVFDADLQGTFQIDNLAFYGQYGHALSAQTRLSLNLRLDRNAIDYTGATNGGAENVGFDISQWLVGGKLALTYQLGTGRNLYAAASRGYRAGGVNQHPRLAAQNRPYDPEYLLNFEAGYRATGPKTTTSLTFFHALRDDQQVSLSSQQNPGDPNSFFFFIANASSGRSSGVEFEQSYLLLPQLRLSGSLGLLSTHVDAYVFETAAGTPATLGDRDAAHAPAYTARLGAEYADPNGLFARLDMTATDAFFHSDSHDQQTEAYQLFHGRVGYRRDPVSLSLWGRNLLDERYAVRGFFFGLEPPDYADTLYVSYGDPRQLGLSLSAAF
jgi:outer membrane receptor protein involved in Fe transport